MALLAALATGVLRSSSLAGPPTRPTVRSGLRLCSSESVGGVVYAAADDAPTVHLFTKAGCTLCDVAKDTLKQAAETHPHTLEAVDITDVQHEEYWGRYKYDIPVLHIGGVYWAKHRISLEEATAALAEAREGRFSERHGEPDAERFEKKR